MWKAGTAIFTMLFNNVFARIAVSSWKTKFASDLNLEFSRCSQFPPKPIHSSSCSVCRELKESQLNSPVCQPEECFSFPHLVPQDEAEAAPQFLLGLALPFLPNSMLNSASWRKMCLKTKGFYTLLARTKIKMRSETWGRWEDLTLCLSQCQDAEDHKSHLSLKTSTFSCPH